MVALVRQQVGFRLRYGRREALQSVVNTRSVGCNNVVPAATDRPGSPADRRAVPTQCPGSGSVPAVLGTSGTANHRQRTMVREQNDRW